MASAQEAHRPICNLAQLSLFAHGDIKEEEDHQPLPEGYAPSPDLVAATLASHEETMEILYRNVDVVHEQLLFFSLKMLGFTGNPEEKEEILAWVFANRYIEIDGKPLDNRDGALTFEMCCRSLGVSAPAMRDHVDDILEMVRRNLERKTAGKAAAQARRLAAAPEDSVIMAVAAH